MDKGRLTWEQNLERDAPELVGTLKDQRFATAFASIEQAEACEASGDFMTARVAYMRAVESITQFDTLTDGSVAKVVAEFKKAYQTFALERDPLFKKYLAALLPVIKESPGILQTELYTKTSVERSDVSYCLYFADAGGLVKREKKGRTYQVTAV